MTGGLIGLYGIFLVFVGAKGNGKKLMDYVAEDGREFSVWLVAILVLFAIYQSEKTGDIGKAFMTLILLAFFLSHYQNIGGEINKITGKQLFEV